MRKILLALVLVGTSMSLNAQSSIKPADLKKNWSAFHQSDAIKVEIRKETCKIEHVDKPFDYAFLRVENTTDEALKVSFQIAVRYSDESCMGCETNVESVRTIDIAPNSSKESDSTFKNGQLSILLKNPFINSSGVEIESIEITNIQVVK